MTKVNLKGLHRVESRGRSYYYAWRGGPRIPGEPGSREFMDAWHAATATRIEDSRRLSALVTQWQKTDRWAKPANEGGMADTTKKNWRPWLDRIRDGLGTLSIKSFDRPEIRQVIKRWRNRWKHAPRHADTGKQVLSALLSYAVEEGLLGVNPCGGIANLYSANRAEIIWTDDDLTRFLPTCSTEIAFALRLACLTGLRESDLLRLCWTHVGDLSIELPSGKSRGRLSYVVPLYDDLRALLDEIAAHQAAQRAAHPDWPVPTTILTTTRGRSWGGGFGSSWNKAKIAADEERLHFHDARGTAATKFYLAGFAPEEIAEIVAWDKSKVEDIINRYVLKESRLRDKIARLAKR